MDRNSAATPRPRVCFEIKATNRQTDILDITLQSRSWEEPKKVPGVRWKLGVQIFHQFKTFSIRVTRPSGTHASVVHLNHIHLPNMRSSGTLHRVERWFSTDVSGKPTGPIPPNLNLEDGTDRLSLNVGTELPVRAAWCPTEAQIKSCFVAAAWMHARPTSD